MRFVLTSGPVGSLRTCRTLNEFLATLGAVVQRELFGDDRVIAPADYLKAEGVIELRAGSRVSDPANTIELWGDGELRFAAKITED